MNLTPSPVQQFFDNNGKPLVGGLLFTYEAGTSTPIATYSDEAGTQNTNPIELDFRGECRIWLDPELSYKFVLAPKGDSDPPTRPIWTADNISAAATMVDVAQYVDVTVNQQFIGQRLWPRTQAEIAAGVVPVKYNYPELDVFRYGAKADGVTDDTQAFQAAVLVAEAGANNSIHPAEGEYLLRGTVTIHQGVAIIGRGSQGSTPRYGFTIVHDSDGDCFVWDGDGANNAGTGGGLRNCLIVKENGRSGGRAIYVYATDDSRRPGEMMFENVLIYSRGTAQWDHCIEIDGRNADTPGSRGVRSTHFVKVRLAGASVAAKYAYFRQALHVYGDIEIDTGNGATPNGVTIEDNWDNINLAGRLGDVVVNYSGSDNPQLFIGGRCGDLDINSPNVVGVIAASIYGTLTNASTLTRITSLAADAFYAYRTSNADGVTGNATPYTVLYDTTGFNRNGSMDPSSGIFTAKSAGLYQFDYAVTLSQLNANNTVAVLNLLHQNSGGSSVNSIDVHGGSIGAARDNNNSFTLRNSVLLQLNEGDTVRVRVTVSGNGSDNVRVVGTAGTRYTYFMGKLLA